MTHSSCGVSRTAPVSFHPTHWIDGRDPFNAKASKWVYPYMLSELTIEEVKGIVERALGEEATAEMVAQIYNVTGAIHRHVDMILPRILDLKNRNEEKLRIGEVKLQDIVTIAGSRLMTGV